MSVCMVTLTLVMAIPTATAGAGEWKTVTSGRGGFSVVVPGEAETLAQTRRGPKGPTKVPMVLSKVGDVTFLALRIANPEPVTPGQREGFFDGVRGSFGEGEGKKLLSEKRLTVGNTPAADFAVEVPGAGGRTLVLRSRFLLWDENTTFNLQVIAPRGQDTERDAARFFASFRTVPVNPYAPEGPVGGAPTWGTFTSAGGGFSVRMPARPVERTQTQHTPHGDFEIHTYLVDRTTAAFAATYYVFPPKVAGLDAAGQQQTLDDMCRGLVSGMKGTILERKPVALGGIPGRAFRFEFPGPDGSSQGLGRAVAFLDGRRAYLIMAHGEPGRVDMPEVDAFLQSFRLTNAAEAPRGAPATTPRAQPVRALPNRQ